MRLTAGPALDRIPAAAWAAVAFLLAVAAVWPGSRPRADLAAVCPLEANGRFGVSCDLSKASGRPEDNWLRTTVVVFEDGTPLREVRHSRQVRKQGLGTYVTETDVLWFSSIDGSSPLHNGRRYEAVAVEAQAGMLSPRFRGVALALSLLALVLAGSRSMGLAYGAAIGVIAVCYAFQAMTALHGPVHVDAGSSLPTARYLAQGALPYRDILFNYTPLGVMALAAWGMLGPVEAGAAHTFSMVLILILECACAFVVFRICRALGVARGLAGAAALSYLSMFVWFDGARILIEPMYLLVILGALLVLITAPPARGAWMAGGLASLALLIKQYGGFGFWGALAAAPGMARPWAAARRIVAGSLVVLAVTSGLLLLAGVDLRVLVNQTAGTDYARRWETVWIKLYFSRAPFLIIAPLLFLKREWRRRPGVIALGGYFLASWMPLLVRQHQYYLHNPSAFLFIAFATLAAYVLSSVKNGRARWVEMAALICLVSVPVRAVLANVERMPPIRGMQERRARLMTSFWPSGQPVLMFAAPGFLALTGYRSPSPAVLGYRFLNESSLDQVRAGMRGATAAWIDSNSMYAGGGGFAKAKTTLKQDLQEHGFAFQLILEDRYELWTKGGVPPARELPQAIDIE
jgi:hypothetical protein